MRSGGGLRKRVLFAAPRRGVICNLVGPASLGRRFFRFRRTDQSRELRSGEFCRSKVQARDDGDLRVNRFSGVVA